MTYQKLQKALEIMGLGERASLAEIRARYRQLVKRCHPDGQSKRVDPEAIQQLNAAYALLRGYCANYRYCFSQEEFWEQNPEERMRRQFATDPLWGKGETSDDDTD